jgi:adenosine deaminase
VAVMEDITVPESGAPQLGDFAAYLRNERIPLEMCPSSNVQTGAVASIEEHPIATLAKLDFRVTVNTDNRLMSATTLTREFELLCDAFDYPIERVRWFSRNAAKSVFAPYEVRKSLVQRVNAFG